MARMCGADEVVDVPDEGELPWPRREIWCACFGEFEEEGEQQQVMEKLHCRLRLRLRNGYESSYRI